MFQRVEARWFQRVGGGVGRLPGHWFQRVNGVGSNAPSTTDIGQLMMISQPSQDDGPSREIQCSIVFAKVVNPFK